MATRIFKYELVPYSETVSMPKGAKLLTVGTQSGKPHVWAAVNDAAKLVDRKLVAVPTGANLSDYLPGLYADFTEDRYVGTVHDVAGALVFHVFDFGEVS